jgi:hypothetical protein
MSHENTTQRLLSEESLGKDSITQLPYDDSYDWVRNPNWLALPTLSETDNKVVGLVQITNYDNHVAFKLATTDSTSYQVDWGDGTIDTWASNAVAWHEYIYTTYDIAGSTLVTHNGLEYKQAVIVATPVSSTISQIDFRAANPNPNVTLSNTQSSLFLDIAINAPLCSALTFGNVGATFNHRLCERFILGKNSISNIIGLFAYCTAIQSVYLHPTTPVAHLGFLFYGCVNLVKAPAITSPINNALTSAFYGCSALRYVPSYNTTGATNFSQLFYGCSSLVSIPWIDTSSATTLESTFQGCISLVEVPRLDTRNVTTLSNTFNGCNSLQVAPFMDTSKVTTMANTFQNCSNLKYIPHYNTTLVTTMANTFVGCVSLKSVPNFYTPAVTSFAYTFFGCNSLRFAPTMDTSKATTLVSMFQNCFNLESVPLYDMTLCTTISNMLNGCYRLIKIPDFNTANVNVMDYAFAYTGIETFPNISFAKATNCNFMFAYCTKLVSVPNLSFTNVSYSQTSSMFANCTSLISVGDINAGTAAIQLANSMFQNCTALKSVGTLTFTTYLQQITTMFSGCSSLQSLIFNSYTTINTMTAAFVNCSSLRKLGFRPYNNFTTTVSGCPNLSEIDTYGQFGGALNIAGCKLGKEALETLITNLRAAGLGNTFTITGNLGVKTPISTSISTTIGSTTASCTNTTGLTVGMQVTGTNSGTTTGATVSYTTGTNVFTLANHGFVNGDIVTMTSSPGSITYYTPYYIVNSTASTFQLSATQGGAVLSVGATSSSGTIRYQQKIVSIVPNTSITFDKPFQQGAAGTRAFQLLNTSLAIIKGYTVTQ